MNYLLIDLAKTDTKWQDIPFEDAKVGLFATLKAAKRMIAPEEPHSIYVLPKKNAAFSIIAAAEEILSHHPDARIAIVSPRKKLPHALEDLQKVYPEAELLLKKRLGKKTYRFIQYADRQPENDEYEEIAEISTDNEQRSDEHASIVVAPMSAKFNNNNPDIEPDVIAALLLLKHNRPKKKNNLVRLIASSVRHDTQRADNILSQLQHKGIIEIDVAENIRYL
ncbi:hypothetical protein [Wielerella bovis]|uniref:hypothetical protein n=1 Tax=Wielerella bovis TaxID=2917790 RepID=UPI002019B0E2|nr:hypothetical protein [Wielerella bovis]ULJ65562.1 hypothetical protein MIS33_04700 [Wielerella bovis]ULJ66394.1 hypothetical protein MIS31_09005 [Wielerella bovis]